MSHLKGSPRLRASHCPAHRLVCLLVASLVVVIVPWFSPAAAAPPTPTAPRTTTSVTATATSTPRAPTAQAAIPLYPGSAPEETSDAADLYLANLADMAGMVFFHPAAYYYNAPAPIRKVAEHYAKTLPGSGWKLLRDNKQYGATWAITTWSRGEQLLCVVAVTQSADKTGLALIVGLKTPVSGEQPGSEPISSTNAAHLARLGSFPIAVSGGWLGVWLPDSAHLILPSKRDQAVVEIDAATGATTKTFTALGDKGPMGFAKMAISADGAKLLLAGERVDPMLVDTKAGKIERALMKADDCWPQAVALAPDGSRAAVSCLKDKSVRLFDARSGKVIASLTPGVAINQLHVTADGKTLIGVSYQEVRIWEAATGKSLGQLGPFKERVGKSALAPDGAQLALGSNNELLIWGVAKRSLMKRLPMEKGVGHLAYSPSGKLLAAQDVGTVTFYDTSAWKKAGSITWVDGEIAFSPDGRLLVGTDLDKVVIYGVLRDSAKAGSTAESDIQARLPVIEIPPSPTSPSAPDLPVYAGATVNAAETKKIALGEMPPEWTDIAAAVYDTGETGASGMKKVCDFYKSKMLELKWQAHKEQIEESMCAVGWRKGDRIAYVVVGLYEKQAGKVGFTLITARGDWSAAGW